ncbi:MAG: SGNH/GDSL hydrolase family protein [Deltaproteobacteria bacterium]|nr:SGNH/GDSL hydrolase family protein [Deltaproteobacteria bacterium]
MRAAALVGLLGAMAAAGEIGARLVAPPVHRGPRELPAKIRLNSREFHDVEHAVEKRPDVRRVLCLGDSFTFARDVAIDRNYCALLAPLAAEGVPGARVEPINYAHEGYSTAHEVRMLENKGGLELAPDVIVLGYVLNDPEDEWHPLKRDALREPTLRREPLGAWAGLTRASALARLAFERLENTRRYHALVAYYHRLHADDHPGWQQCRDAFARLGEITRERGIPVLVAIFPLLDFPLGARYPFGELHAQVAALARANGLAALDLRPALAPRAGPERLRVPGVDPHPSTQAHHLVARAIADEIARQGWLAAPPSPSSEPAAATPAP